MTMENVTAKGDYFAMNSENLTVSGLTLYGNYSFDGVKNMEIKNSRLLSKDAFRNSENVTVRDSFISGEYLGWNAKNLTLINCAVESLQGMCCILQQLFVPVVESGPDPVPAEGHPLLHRIIKGGSIGEVIHGGHGGV